MARLQQATLNRGNRTMLFLALGAGLLAAIVVFIAINNSGGDGGSVSAPSTSKVVVAAKDIQAGDKISANMVEVKEVPQNLLVKGAYTDSQVLVGQAVNTTIAKGEQITPARVGTLPEDVKDDISYVLPAGKRAVAVSVREVTAVGGLLLPGHRVDVVAAVKEKDSPETDVERLVVTTILQNVEVLSVAQEAQQPAPKPADGPQASPAADSPISGIRPEDAETKPSAGSVTLALDPQQLQLLVAMEGIADDIWLALRPFGEDGTPAIEPISFTIYR